MSETYGKQDVIECSDDENYGFIQNQVIVISCTRETDTYIYIYIYSVDIIFYEKLPLNFKD